MFPPPAKRVKVIPKIILALATVSPLLGQAWLFPKGEGAVSLGYQNNFLPDHVFSKGERRDSGPIYSQGMLMEVDYSLTDKFGARITLPYLAAKYVGPSPHQLPIDDGTYHPRFQDLHLDIRYNIGRRPLMLTPFFELVIPTNHYEHYAHSAIGRDLREYHLGVNLGRRLDPFLRKAYFQVRYSYSISQEVTGLAANNADRLRFSVLGLSDNEPANSLRPRRCDTEFQVGYFLTPRLSLMALGSWQYSFNGIDYTLGIYPQYLTAGQLFNHDRIALTSIVDMGGGASIAATRSVDLFVSAVTAVRVRNAHALGAGVAAGVSWHFITPWARERPLPAPVGASR